MNDRGVAEAAVATEHLRPLSLEVVTAVANLQTRVDRKYIVAPAPFATLVRELRPAVAVLEIAGVRSFRYESVYFDTPTLDSYCDAAHGRRRRFKVRTRSYLDSGTCTLEVKTRNGRGETVKHRTDYEFGNRGLLNSVALDFVRGHARLPVGSDLAPVLTTSYRRATLVDIAAGARLTCDAGLVCTSADGGSVSLPHHLLVETKSSGTPSPADHLLWALGCRPVTVSKYCVGMAVLDPSLPANRWNRTLRHYFGWTPDHEFRVPA